MKMRNVPGVLSLVVIISVKGHLLSSPLQQREGISPALGRSCCFSPGPGGLGGPVAVPLLEAAQSPSANALWSSGWWHG